MLKHHTLVLLCFGALQAVFFLHLASAKQFTDGEIGYSSLSGSHTDLRYRDVEILDSFTCDFDDGDKMCGWSSQVLLNCSTSSSGCNASTCVSPWEPVTLDQGNPKFAVASKTSRRPENVSENIQSHCGEKPSSLLVSKLYVPERPYEFVPIDISVTLYANAVPGILLAAGAASYDYDISPFVERNASIFGLVTFNLSLLEAYTWNNISLTMCVAGASDLLITASHSDWDSVVYIDEIVARSSNSQDLCEAFSESGQFGPFRKGTLECAFNPITNPTPEHHYSTCGWKEESSWSFAGNSANGDTDNLVHVGNGFLDVYFRNQTAEDTVLGVVLTRTDDFLRLRSARERYDSSVSGAATREIEFEYAVLVKDSGSKPTSVLLEWSIYLAISETKCRTKFNGRYTDGPDRSLACRLQLWLGYLFGDSTAWTRSSFRLSENILRSSGYYFFEVTATMNEEKDAAVIALDNISVKNFSTVPAYGKIQEMSCGSANENLCRSWTLKQNGTSMTQNVSEQIVLQTGVWYIPPGKTLCARTSFGNNNRSCVYPDPAPVYSPYRVFAERVTITGEVMSAKALHVSDITDSYYIDRYECPHSDQRKYVVYFAATDFVRLRFEEDEGSFDQRNTSVVSRPSVKVDWIGTVLLSENDVVTGLECKMATAGTSTPSNATTTESFINGTSGFQTETVTSTAGNMNTTHGQVSPEQSLLDLLAETTSITPEQLPSFTDQFFSSVSSATSPGSITVSELDAILNIFDFVHASTENESLSDSVQISATLLQTLNSVLDVKVITNATHQQANAYGSRIIQAFDRVKHHFVPTEEELDPFVQPSLATSVRSVMLQAPEDIRKLNFTYGIDLKIGNATDNALDVEFTNDAVAERNTGLKVRLDPGIIRDTWIQADQTDQHVLIEVGAFYPPEFATFDFDSDVGTRSARSIAPAIVSGHVPGPAQNSQKIVIIEMNLKKLFQNDEKFKNYVGAKSYSCVFLKYLQTNQSDISSASASWSSEGCYHVKTYKDDNGDLLTQCACDHLTNIGSLVDLCGTNPLYSFDDIAQKTLSTVLGTISIVCSAIVIAHILFQTYQSKDFLIPPVFIRLNLAVSIALSHITLIVGQYLPYSGEGHEDACLTAAVFSQWFLLVSFAWMAVECFRMTLYRINVLAANAELRRLPGDSFRSFFVKSSAVAWGCPFVPVLFAFSFHVDGSYGIVYGSDDQWCWIHPQSFWFLLCTFVLPMILVVAFNMAAVLHHYYKEHKRRSEKEKESEKPSRLQYDNIIEVVHMFIMLMFLGFGWLLGFLMQAVCQNDLAKEVTSYFFIIINGLQGLYLLMFYARTQGASYIRFWNGLKFTKYEHAEYNEISNLFRRAKPIVELKKRTRAASKELSQSTV